LGRDGVTPIESLWHGHGLSLLSVGTLRFLLGGCVVLALGIVLGVRPRFCATVLFVFAGWMHKAIAPVAYIDDVVVDWTLFWLALLPVGNTLSPFSWSARRSWSTERVSGWTANAFMVYVLVLHLDVGLWRDLSLSWSRTIWVPMAMCGIAVCFVMPGAVARALGAGASLGVHGYLCRSGGGAVAHGIAAAATMLLWGEQPGVTADPPRRRALGIEAAIGASAVTILCLFQLSGRWGGRLAPLRNVHESTGRLLADVGLLPLGSGTKLQPERYRLWMENAQGRTTPLSFGDGVRMQLLLGHLDEAEDGRFIGAAANGYLAAAEKLEVDLLRSLASPYCRANREGTDGEQLGYLLLSSKKERRRLAWIDCQGDDRETSIVPLSGTQSQARD
jgi:hypothetical protein